jgi:CelD/BcsL family acetyltransferase involved in cellulose biosynthesis
MSYSISETDLDSLDSFRSDTSLALNWNPIFIIPGWLKVWWQIFGGERDQLIRVVRNQDRVIGIAPLLRDGSTVSFIGDTDVCDYQDFIIEPGFEEAFFSTLLDDLKANGVELLDLKHVRYDSAVSQHLYNVVQNRGLEAIYEQQDISVEMDLPETWDDYMTLLHSKQRHEVRRKIRRLSEAGNIEYIWAEDITDIPGFMDGFFQMFTESREDKAQFLTGRRKEFFRLLAAEMAHKRILKPGMLRLDGRDMASIICFDYNDSILLYNSGYDPEFNYLSVGLLSKVLCIKENIASGKKVFNFLKGNEPYKFHLGGREVPLYGYRIRLD